MEPSAAQRPDDGRRFWNDLRDSVSRAVVVDEMPLRLLAVALLAHGHALVEDVPGVGKTLLTRCVQPRAGPDLRAASRARPTCCPLTSPGVEPARG